MIFIAFQQKIKTLKKNHNNERDFGCMTGWVRDPNSTYLNRLETNLDNSGESKSEFEEKGWVKRNLDQGCLMMSFST